MSLSIHNEIVKNSKINFAISGRFVDGNKLSWINVKDYFIHQILLVKNNFFEIYDVMNMKNKKDEEETIYKYNFLVDYKVFGEITSVEKFQMANDTVDSIILAIDYAKIAIVQYDPNYKDFKILCLYNLENENLSNGKKFYNDPIQIMTSTTYNSILLLTNNTSISILLRKSQFSNMTVDNENKEEDQIQYLDTISGENYFEPSFYFNFHNYGINKIIKFYVYNKENEHFDYFNNINSLPIEENICLLILYQESGFSTKSMETSSNIVANPNFYKNKINLALCYINRQTKSIDSFEILFENLDQNSFDIFCISLSKIAVVAAPYCLQLVLLDQKICLNIILNPVYGGVFHREYTMNNITNMKADFSHFNLGLDLRGGSFIVISNSQLIFTTSKGLLYVLSIENPIKIKIEQIHTQFNNEISLLEAPYKFILMPHPGIFYLASLFSDACLMIYDGSNYHIKNKMVNISPIVNYIPVVERCQVKHIFTTGYNKNGQLNFLYDKFFYDINFATQEYQEISYLKSLNFDDCEYTKYLLVSFKNGKSIVYQVSKSFENITDSLNLNQSSKIVTANVIEEYQFIVIVYENSIQFFDNFFRLILEINLSQFVHVESCDMIEDKIRHCKIGQNTLIINTYLDKYILLYIQKKQSDELFTLNEELVNLKRLELNNLLDIIHKEVTTSMNINPHKILKLDINSKFISGCTYLVVYRENNSIEIYDLRSLLGSSEPIPIFENKLIGELPVILSDSRTGEAEKDYQKSSSDLSAELIIKNNIPHYDILTTPEEIFFDVLSTKIVFSVVFKNGVIVFYEVFFIIKDNLIQTLRMKKFYSNYMENIDYRDLFYSEVTNLFIKFDNINEKSGLLLNIKGCQKMLFEIDGQLKFFDFDTNVKLRSFSAFSELSKEGSKNGFVFYENGYFTIANIPNNYNICELGLLKRTPLNHFPVKLNYILIQQGGIPFYYYITIEKELRIITIKSGGKPVNVNKFIYFLCLRNDDSKVIDQVEFPAGEIIIESNIVDLMNLHKIKTKYIAVGVNICDEKGEEVTCKAKLMLYNIENGKFVNTLTSDLRGCISMIHSINGILIIGEGNKIYIYQYVPLTNEIKKLSVIDNKSLIVCSKVQSKFIITGDLFESATWIVFKSDQDFNNSSIYILGKDQSKYHSTAIDFWIDDCEETYNTGCILADDNCNLHIFTINPELNSPNRLNEVADIHLGKKVTELRYFTHNNKSNVYYSTSEGSIGYLKPITKITFDKLSLLCEFMYNHLPFRAGLNPKMFFSTYLRNSNTFKKEKGNIIDHEVLSYYMYLPITTQKIIAKNVMLTRESIINTINEVKN